MCRRRQRTLTAAISASKTPEIPVVFCLVYRKPLPLFSSSPMRRVPTAAGQTHRKRKPNHHTLLPRVSFTSVWNTEGPWSVLHAAPSVSLTDKKNPDIQGWGAAFFHANLLLSAPTTRLWFAKAAPAGAVSSSPRGSARAQRRICISA